MEFSSLKFYQQTVFLTPNRRLARHLQQQKKIDFIFPYQVWLADFCAKHSHLVLLNEFQEHAIWNSIVTPSELTPLVQQAWAIIKQWQIPLATLNDDTEETRAFKAWAQAFDLHCQKHNLCDQNTLPEMLIALLRQKKIILPQRLCLVGFDNLYPQLINLLQTLAEFTAIEYVDPNDSIAQEQCLACADMQAEILTMAYWAKKTLLTHPHAYIGCIVPNLTEVRTAIERIFSKVFQDFPTPPFNISAGKSLSQCPIVYTALKILELNTSFNLDHLSYLLNSSYIVGSNEEKNDRLSLRSELKSLALEKISLNLISQFQKCPLFVQALKAISERRNTNAKPSYWAQAFLSQLEIFGLGNNALDQGTPLRGDLSRLGSQRGESRFSPLAVGANSLRTNIEIPKVQEENSALQRFQQILQDFSLLDSMFNGISGSQAANYVQNLVNTTIFQTHNEQRPIDILGTLEAAGINFDALWMMGMDSCSWPSSPMPNPLIPMFLQRKLGLPHATYERELEFSTKLLHRFKRSTSTIIYSYPIQIDGESRNFTLMLPNVPRVTNQELSLEIVDLPITDDIEPIIQEHNLPIGLGEKINGGSKILELEALCPFRAFAMTRLHTETKPAWRHTIRGILVHVTLEKIWKKIISHNSLVKYSDIELEELIASVLDMTMNNIAKHVPDNFLKIEFQCIKKIIHKWLQLEKTRAPFSVIALEQIKEIQLKDLTIRLRIDRIDQLEDGALLIIDYKTTKQTPSVSSWLSGDLTNLQLPLYCVSSRQASALAFAELKPDRVAFKGIANRDLGIEGIKTISADEWSGLLTKWQEAITKLADDFCAGNLALTQNDANCRNCDLAILCHKKSRF